MQFRQLCSELEGAKNRLNILLHCLRVDLLGYNKIDIVVILMIVQDRNSGKVIPNIILIDIGNILLHPLIIANSWCGIRGCNSRDLSE